MKPPFIVVCIIKGKRMYAAQMSNGFTLTESILDCATFMQLDSALACSRIVRDMCLVLTPTFKISVYEFELEKLRLCNSN